LGIAPRMAQMNLRLWNAALSPFNGLSEKSLPVKGNVVQPYYNGSRGYNRDHVQIITGSHIAILRNYMWRSRLILTGSSLAKRGPLVKENSPEPATHWFASPKQNLIRLQPKQERSLFEES
jgi:hypothetical protein